MATTPRKPPGKPFQKKTDKEKVEAKAHKPATGPATAPMTAIKAAIRAKEHAAEQKKPAAPVAAAAPVVVAMPSEPGKPERKLDKYGRAYATGKRKNAIARVWLKPGSGKILVNGRELRVYFARPVLQMMVNQPFGIANRANQFDAEVLVNGGGLSGQAGAVKHGISKALTYFEPELRKPLKAALFLRRDARVVERKKYGRVKARKRFQYSKR